jgi:hypothetical protein
MRSVWIISALALLVLNALTLVPAMGAFQPYLLGASLVVALVLLVAIIAARHRNGEPSATRLKSAKTTPPAPARNQADAEVISFIAILQEKGRLIDFLMDDITAYDDAQVGAAARVVHEGCKAALREHLRIRPIRGEAEGLIVEVPPGYAADEYRLIGKVRGQAPFSGILVHRGWKTDSVELPRILHVSADRLPTIAPAEIELR